MLTGDSRTTAEAVARRLGIDEVVAEVQPADEAEMVKRLQAWGQAMPEGRGPAAGPPASADVAA